MNGSRSSEPSGATRGASPLVPAMSSGISPGWQPASATITSARARTDANLPPNARGRVSAFAAPSLVLLDLGDEVAGALGQQGFEGMQRESLGPLVAVVEADVH